MSKINDRLFLNFLYIANSKYLEVISNGNRLTLKLHKIREDFEILNFIRFPNLHEISLNRSFHLSSATVIIEDIPVNTSYLVSFSSIWPRAMQFLWIISSFILRIFQSREFYMVSFFFFKLMIISELLWASEKWLHNVHKYYKEITRVLYSNETEVSLCSC